MNYKIIISLCVLGLSSCDAKNFEEKATSKPLVNQKEKIIQKNSIKVIGDSFSQSGRNGFDKISVVQMDKTFIYSKEVVVFKK